MTGSESGPTEGGSPGISVLDTDDCVALLRSTPVGRIAFVHDDRLTVLPVTFAWSDDAIVFRTLDGEKLQAADQFQDVAFEVDEWDVRSHTGWSVLVRGVAEHIEDWAEIEQLEQTELVPWAREEWRRMWVKVVPGEITGRRIP